MKGPAIHPYPVINIFFTGILFLLFLYSLIFSAEKDNHPIPSVYKKITGSAPLSSGLSRGFSEIVRGRFESAQRYNPYSLRIFCFFAAQLLLRILFLVLYLRLKKSAKFFIVPDVVISGILFIISFWPFLAEMGREIVN